MDITNIIIDLFIFIFVFIDYSNTNKVKNELEYKIFCLENENNCLRQDIDNLKGIKYE